MATFIRISGSCISAWEIENLWRQKTMLAAFPVMLAMNGSTFFNLGEAMAALGALILLGFVVFSPSARARWHLFRCNYTAAAEIYESLLARHPDRLKLYSILAEIYLLLPRYDAQALKVFKKVLQFNLDTPNREEIDIIVVQSYLKNDCTDAEAVTILENALRAEYRKNNPALKRKVLSHDTSIRALNAGLGRGAIPKRPDGNADRAGQIRSHFSHF
jgi:tetratricopeptide (TPR) repeat protein